MSGVTAWVVGVDKPNAAGSRGMEESLRYSNMILVIFTKGSRSQQYYKWYPTRTVGGQTSPYHYLAYSECQNNDVAINYLLTPKHFFPVSLPPPPSSSHSPWAVSLAVSSLLFRVFTACSSQCALSRSTLIRFLGHNATPPCHHCHRQMMCSSFLSGVRRMVSCHCYR